MGQLVVPYASLDGQMGFLPVVCPQLAASSCVEVRKVATDSIKTLLNPNKTGGAQNTDLGETEQVLLFSS